MGWDGWGSVSAPLPRSPIMNTLCKSNYTHKGNTVFLETAEMKKLLIGLSPNNRFAPDPFGFQPAWSLDLSPSLLAVQRLLLATPVARSLHVPPAHCPPASCCCQKPGASVKQFLGSKVFSFFISRREIVRGNCSLAPLNFCCNCNADRLALFSPSW